MRRAIALLTAFGVSATATAAKPVPRQLAQVKGLKLGDSVQTFIGQFSATELDSSVKGVRFFDVKANSLPEGVTRLRCDFKDGKLAYAEAALGSVPKPWSAFIAEPIQAYGAPKTLKDVLGLERLHVARPEESAVWSDRSASLVFAREGGNYTVAVVDAKWLQGLAAVAKDTASDEQATAEQTARLQGVKEDVHQRARDAAAELRRVLSDPEGPTASAVRTAASSLVKATDQIRDFGDPVLDYRGELPYAKKLAQEVRGSEFTIVANQDWQDSGFAVRPGEAMILTASGAWTMVPNGSSSGPDGVVGGVAGARTGYFLASAPIGIMVCQIGSNGAPFAAGHQIRFQVEEGGRVFCVPNSVLGFGPATRSGSMRVKAVALPPLPASLAEQAQPPTQDERIRRETEEARERANQ